jgi:hypothetical protein
MLTLKEEIKNLSKQKYILLTLLLSLFFLFLSGIFLFESSTFGLVSRRVADILSKIFGSLSLAFFIASIIQYIKGETLERYLNEELKTQISTEVLNAANQVKENIKLENIFLPYKVYHPIEEKGNEAINQRLTKVQRIQFFGTSANYFLKMRLPLFKDKIDSKVLIELLLHNPQDESNLKERTRQMEEEKGDKLYHTKIKLEVIVAIIRVIYLAQHNHYFEFSIRFHSEEPIYRLEFYGNDLFLGFYNIRNPFMRGDGGKGTGPLAHYEKQENYYIFKTFQDFFDTVWDNHSESEILITPKHPVDKKYLEDLRKIVGEDLDLAINEIFSSAYPGDYEIIQWLKS